MAEYTKIETARSIICDLCECSYPGEYCPEKFDLEKCDLMEHLKEDAADVAPVRHGRWIASHDEFCACSICKYPVYVGWNQTNYCPNCGARMDGGSENG